MWQKNSLILSKNITSGVQPFRAVNFPKYLIFLMMLVEIWVLEGNDASRNLGIRGYIAKHHDAYKKKMSVLLPRVSTPPEGANPRFSQVFPGHFAHFPGFPGPRIPGFYIFLPFPRFTLT